MRLREYGPLVALLDDERYKNFKTKKENIKKLEEILKNNNITYLYILKLVA